jgi:carbamoyltransferase
MVNQKFVDLFKIPLRKSEQLLTQVHMDLAASIQAATEEIILRLTRVLARETNIPNLCLAGGVALNCVANGKILRDRHFKKVWIQPAAGDAGGALGAALTAHYDFLKNPRFVANGIDDMQGSYLGPAFEQTECEKRLQKLGAKFEILPENQLIQVTAQAIAQGKAVGWFSGRMEFGPRALGARSILGDARSPSMQKTLNLRIKYRESFRPFAPSVLRENVSEWFELNEDSPYMLLVADVVKKRQHAMSEADKTLFGIDKLNISRSEIPAVTHIDYSARIQTVHKETNPRYHALLKEFQKQTDCPVIVNTSFNVRGEPIICTPEDAFRCFMGTDIEVLVVENCFLKKEDQNPLLQKSYKDQFELD